MLCYVLFYLYFRLELMKYIQNSCAALMKLRVIKFWVSKGVKQLLINI